MNQLQLYQTPDAEFPARRPEPLTIEQWEAVNFAYERQPAFIRRYVVTGLVLVAGTTLVAFDIIATGFNVAAAVAAVAGVCVASSLRAVFHVVTNNAATSRPDMEPATRSRETTAKQTTITIVNNVTVNQ